MSFFKDIFNFLKPDSCRNYEDIKDDLTRDFEEFIEDSNFIPNSFKNSQKNKDIPRLVNNKADDNLPVYVTYGAIVFSPIFKNEQHVGICNGHRIIEMTRNGIKNSTKTEFLDGLLTDKLYTFSSNGIALSFKTTMKNADDVLNKHTKYNQNYNLISNNCIKFVVYCITGDINNDAVQFEDLIKIINENYLEDNKHFKIVPAKLY